MNYYYMYWLTEELVFPNHNTANADGVLALGGDLSLERLLLAYKTGVFPWFNEGEHIVWYTPSERMVLFPEEIRITKSMRKVCRKQEFLITENKAFEEVMYNCKNIQRDGQYGTWITDDMFAAYLNLHKKGYAKSIEVWSQEGVLIGGLYGVAIGNRVFCGESMFSKRSNMSKVAFIHLAKHGGYKLIDCQVYNTHLESLGAREISRDDFLQLL